MFECKFTCTQVSAQEKLPPGCQTRKDMNWPARTPRLHRVLKFCLYILHISILAANNKCADLTVDAQVDLHLCSHLGLKSLKKDFP